MQKLYKILLWSVLCVGSSNGMEIVATKSSQRSLFESIDTGDFDKLKAVVDNEPTIVNEYCFHPVLGDTITPLHLAVYKKDSAVVEYLLKANADSNLQEKHWKNSPLHRAPNKVIAKLLVKYGANVKSKNKRGRLPLYSSFFGCEGMRFDVAHYLLKKCGLSGNGSVNSAKNSLLHEACKRNKSSMVTFLLEHKVNTDYRNALGETALDIAIKLDHWDVVKCFGEAHIIFMPCEGYYNPFNLLQEKARLFVSLPEKKKGAAENLLSQLFIKMRECEQDQLNGGCVFGGAKREIIINEKGCFFKHVLCVDLERLVGKEAIDCAQKSLTDRCKKALSAAQSSNYDLLKTIITDCPFVLTYDKNIAFDLCAHVIDKNDEKMTEFLLRRISHVSGVDNEGNTFLHRAMASGNVHAIHALVSRDIDLNITNNTGKTALDLAHDQKSKDIFNSAFADRFFSTSLDDPSYHTIEKFLKSNSTLHALDVYGRSLLHRAVRNHPEKCDVLLKNGAQVNIRDNQGESPFSLAVSSGLQSGNVDLVLLLTQYGGLVDNRILDKAASSKYMQDALRGAKKPQCCICLGEFENIANIPCERKHTDSFMCKECCDQIHQINSLCPLCRGIMGEYVINSL